MNNNKLNFQINNLVISQKFDNALAFNDYSAQNALLWGNCAAHFRKACSGNWRDHKVHLLIAVVELLPIIGQIASIFEAIIVRIVVRKTCIEDKKMVFHNVFHKSSKDLTDFLVDYAANPNFRSKNDLTPLMKAILEGDEQIINLLVSDQANLNAKNADGCTTLMWAIQEDQPETTIKILIDAGGDLDIQQGEGLTSMGYTALMWSISENKQEIVKMLIDAGANPNTRQKEGCWSDEYTPLMLAGRENKQDIIKMLIETGKVDLNSKDKNGQTAFMLAVGENRQEIIKTLIETDQVDLNSKDNNGQTALMLAALLGRKESLQLLIDADADLDIQNDEGDTALMIATSNKDSEVVEMLVNARADLDIQNNKGDTALIGAMRIKNNSEVIQILIKAGSDLDIQNSEGDTALIGAASLGYKEIVQALVNNGADLDIQDSEGYTALIDAAAFGYEEIVQILIDAGANLDIQTNKGFTAIRKAAGLGHNQIVETLFQAGANVQIRPPNPKFSPILSELKSHRHKNFKSLFDSISKKNLELLKEYKEETLVTAISHTTSLKGNIELQHSSENISPLSVRLEGFHSPFWLNKMHKATQLMHKNHSAIFSEEENHLLDDALVFGANLNAYTPAEILGRIQQDLPVMLHTGYTGHYVSVLVWGSYFIICNRGGASRAPIEIFQYDQEKLDEKTIQEIINCANKSKEDYQQLFFTTLPQTLSFEQEELEKSIQEKCPLPKQIVGNCSWLSPETAVWALLVWQKIRESEEPNIEESIQTETQRFNSWLVFNQLYHLERYMNIYQLRKEPEVEKDPNRARDVYKIDTDLIKRAFESSFSLKDEEIDESIAEQRRLLHAHFTTNF